MGLFFVCLTIDLVFRRTRSRCLPRKTSLQSLAAIVGRKTFLALARTPRTCAHICEPSFWRNQTIRLPHGVCGMTHTVLKASLAGAVDALRCPRQCHQARLGNRLVTVDALAVFSTLDPLESSSNLTNLCLGNAFPAQTRVSSFSRASEFFFPVLFAGSRSMVSIPPARSTRY